MPDVSATGSNLSQVIVAARQHDLGGAAMLLDHRANSPAIEHWLVERGAAIRDADEQRARVRLLEEYGAKN